MGCSIEISRDIYYKYSTLPRGISVYVAPKVGIFPDVQKYVGGITWLKRAHAESQIWAVKTDL